MNIEQKTEALLCVAKAFYDRGRYIQYDQRSLDRILQLTPRPRKFLPPEAATPDNTTFLDCSGFVNAMYYQAFGVELPADLTWHMIDYVKPQIFYYELTHKETPEDMKEIEENVLSFLLPGDVITLDRGVGNGHTMLYLGNGEYTDCTVNGRPNSYDYENKKSREYAEGGLWRQPLASLFISGSRKSLFKENVRRFAVARPLELMGEPTKETLARMTTAKDLFCGVLTNFPGGRQATYGESVVYTVFVRNQSFMEKTAKVTFQMPGGKQEAKELHLSPRGRETAVFSVVAEQTAGFRLAAPTVTVNGLHIYVPEVLVGQGLDAAAMQKLTETVVDKMQGGKTAMQAAAEAYEAYGVSMSGDEKEHFNNCFYLHDSTGGDVVSRKPQNPGADLGVLTYFGGIGTVTPEFAIKDGVRCYKISTRDLLPGDVLLVSDDANGKTTYSSFYTGKQLVGRFCPEESVSKLSRAETDAYVDSLFGRFSFILLRPVNGKR
ncbi:MAG: C40 family peptidase [Clostridia bacterium]|nr:C40 family peptidase [Clostridia bacterium]